MSAFIWTAVFIALLLAPAIWNWVDLKREDRRECEEYKNGYRTAMPD